MAGMGGMGGMAGLAGADGMAAAPTEAGALPWGGLALAVGVTALGVLALRRWRTARAPLNTLAAAALLFAGVAHCALTPSHWAEGWHLGLFFAASGVLLAVQGVAVGVWPSAAVHASVLASTLGLLVLYVLVREFAVPFVDHRDPYLITDVPVKVAELAAAGVAGLALIRARVASPALPTPHPVVVPVS